MREGVIVRLTDSAGRVGYGEAAPVPGFSRETAPQIVASLSRSSREKGAVIGPVPEKFASLRWALDCAQAMIAGGFSPLSRAEALPVAALLPAGAAARAALARYTAEGYRAFKWKIATGAVRDECRWLDALLARLPAGAKLRLDANGGLDAKEFSQWTKHLRALGKAAQVIEFFEQPFSPAHTPAQWAAQRRRANDAPVPVALDESVTGLAAMRAARWPGPLVVKPSLLGDLADFLRWRARRKPDLVYSSAFETSVGLHAALWLAATDAHAGKRAVGFGTLAAFADDGLQLPAHAPGPTLTPTPLSADDFADLWNRLPTPG